MSKCQNIISASGTVRRVLGTECTTASCMLEASTLPLYGRVCIIHSFQPATCSLCFLCSFLFHYTRSLYLLLPPPFFLMIHNSIHSSIAQSITNTSSLHTFAICFPSSFASIYCIFKPTIKVQNEKFNSIDRNTSQCTMHVK